MTVFTLSFPGKHAKTPCENADFGKAHTIRAPKCQRVKRDSAFEGIYQLHVGTALVEEFHDVHRGGQRHEAALLVPEVDLIGNDVELVEVVPRALDGLVRSVPAFQGGPAGRVPQQQLRAGLRALQLQRLEAAEVVHRRTEGHAPPVLESHADLVRQVHPVLHLPFARNALRFAEQPVQIGYGVHADVQQGAAGLRRVGDPVGIVLRIHAV